MTIRRVVRNLGRRLASSRWSPLRTVVSVRTDRPEVALTFDDGPDPEYTPRLLDVLDHHGATATFFVVGKAALRHPELVREIADRGHVLGNHTHTHPSLPSLDSDERVSEILKCGRALSPRPSSAFFRPPKGHQTVSTRLDVLRCGYDVVAWSADADDWNVHSEDWFARRIAGRIAPGEIVLLHDGLWDPVDPDVADRAPLIGAVDRVLGSYSGTYRFVTLPQLMAGGSTVREGWFRRPPSLGARGTYPAASVAEVKQCE